MSIRLRLTILYTAIVALTLIVFTGAVYALTERVTLDAAKQTLIAQAQQIVAGYESYLAGEKMIRQLDSNPFAPGLNIEATLTASLDALNRTLASVAASIR